MTSNNHICGFRDWTSNFRPKVFKYLTSFLLDHTDFTDDTDMAFVLLGHTDGTDDTDIVHYIADDISKKSVPSV